jgi:hypothetical protein
MTADAAGEDIGQKGVGVGAGEFAALDEAGEDGTVPAPSSDATS